MDWGAGQRNPPRGPSRAYDLGRSRGGAPPLADNVPPSDYPCRPSPARWTRLGMSHLWPAHLARDVALLAIGFALFVWLLVRTFGR